MVRRVLILLGIREDERRLVAGTVALFLVTQSTHGLGANAADTLFFLRFGVEELPRMIVIAGIVVMVMVLGHTVGLSYRGERRWLPLVGAASSAWVFLAWAGVFTDSPLVYPVIWVTSQGIIMLTFTMMWNAAGAMCTTRQAKRLFPLFATAGVAGGILGNLATGPIAGIFGAPSLLLAQGSLLLISTGLLTRLRSLMTPEPEGGERGAAAARLGETLGAIRSSPFLLLAAAVAFTTWILFYMVVFPFSESVAASFDSEPAMAGFLGIFSSLATAATFVVGLVLAKRLFYRIGIVMSLLILPVVYALGFGLWLLEFDLGTAAVVRGLQWVAVNAIGGTAFSALFNVLTGRRRAQVAALMTAVPAQLGVISGGLLLIASQGMADTTRFGIGLAVSVVAVGAVIAMRPAYVEAILASVRRGLVGLFNVPSPGLLSPMDAEARRILERRLADERPEARAYAISALARLRGSEGVGEAIRYLDDESPVVRATAFDVVCQLDPDGFRDHAATALADETPEVRIRALHYAAANDVPEAALGALDDGDPRVRSTAAVIVGGEKGREVAREILERGDARALRALLAEIARMGDGLGLDLDPLLRHEDAEVRAWTARASMAAGVDPNDLRSCLDDPSLRVRTACAEALAGSPEGRDMLTRILQVGTVNETDAALRALMPFEALTSSLVEWAKGEAARACELDRLGKAIRADGATPVALFLARVLAARTERLEQWVLMAMTTVETAEIMPLVQKGVVAADVETKAQAIEALEAIGDRRVMTVLLPLLERSANQPDMSEREALRTLSTDFDPWLRALAVKCLAELVRSDLGHLHQAASSDDSDLVREVVPSLSTMPVEKSDSLGVMDRVLALQRVPMFSDLDAEDLELLARSTTEMAYEPGEVVYSEGTEGAEVLMIVEGSAVVSVDRDGRRRVITTFGPGESVGELALLRSGVRSADVTAGSDGLHGLVITKSDFVSILEERPSVALGMMATLADRMVEET